MAQPPIRPQRIATKMPILPMKMCIRDRYIIVKCDDADKELETKANKVDITSNGEFKMDATNSTKISYLNVTYDPVEITPETVSYTHLDV